MNREQLLFLKLAEECAEVAQMASKVMQFGQDEVRRDQELTNRERCHIEIDDLIAVIYMLNEEFNFNYHRNNANIAVKQAKVDRYAMYATELGLVEAADGQD